jgi:hypothetical protein
MFSCVVWCGLLWFGLVWFVGTQIAAEGSGLNSHTIDGAWAIGLTDDGSAAGCNNHGRYLKNPMYKFKVFHNSRSGFSTGDDAKATSLTVFARLQCTNGTPFAINLSLYPCQQQQGPASVDPTTIDSSSYLPKANVSPKKALATSAAGIYSDATCGVWIPETEVTSANNSGHTGVYCLVPSTFSPLECSSFRIQLYYSGHESALKFL